MRYHIYIYIYIFKLTWGSGGGAVAQWWWGIACAPTEPSCVAASWPIDAACSPQGALGRADELDRAAIALEAGTRHLGYVAVIAQPPGNTCGSVITPGPSMPWKGIVLPQPTCVYLHISVNLYICMHACMYIYNVCSHKLIALGVGNGLRGGLIYIYIYI